MELYKIILLDNDEELKSLIMSAGIAKRVDMTKSFADAKSNMKKEEYDVIIINPAMHNGSIEGLVNEFQKKKLPVLVILDRYSDVENVIEALLAGAFDYFLRPLLKVLSQPQIEEIKDEITMKIELSIKNKEKISPIEKIKEEEIGKYDFSNSSKKVIVIGSSTGGPQSLECIIPLFPKEIPGPIIVVQHMPEAFTKKLAERLNEISEVKVKEAEDEEEIKDGVCYIAKGDYHLELKKGKDSVRVSLNHKERILGVRPCANLTMESAANIYGSKVIGIVLTGMGSDGTIGAKKIKEKGGTVIVESEKTSILYGMPKSVVQSGYYDAIVDLDKIPVAVLQVLEV